MKLLDLIKAANKYYDDGILTLEGFYDEEGRALDQTDDTLARFILIEMHDTYEAEKSDEEQVLEAIRVLRNGADELESAIQGLEELL